MIRFGILGCGNIGRFVIRNLARPEFKQLSLQVLSDVPKKELLLKELAAAHRCAYTIDPDTLIDRQLQLVMEAATPAVVKRHVPPLLRAGIHVLAMSVGAFADEEMLAEAARAAEAGGSRLLLPTGAIAGLDYLKAAQLEGLEEASITITKSPKSLAGAPHFQNNPVDLFALCEPTAVFAGSAREAISGFPANVNVAVAVSLASVGPDKTWVQVICDPAATQTRFNIRARGATGEMQIELTNFVSPDNPRTSYQACCSALATLRRFSDSLQIGT